jgi:hypothetical protein
MEVTMSRVYLKGAVRLAIAGVLIASGWQISAIYAQNTAVVRKDYINPSPGRFSGAVVVHGEGVKIIYISGHTGRARD